MQFVVYDHARPSEGHSYSIGLVISHINRWQYRWYSVGRYRWSYRLGQCLRCFSCNRLYGANTGNISPWVPIIPLLPIQSSMHVPVEIHIDNAEDGTKDEEPSKDRVMARDRGG